MRTGAKVALAGSVCALSLFCMLLTILPTLEWGLPALAGVLLVVPVIEMGVRWGLMGYAAVGFLSLLMAPSVESRMLFLLFFGYYPVVKALLERIPQKTICWAAKLLLFNAAMILSYFLLFRLTTAVDVQDFTIFGVYLPGVILALGNVVFVVYDIGITRLIRVYLYVWQPWVHRFLHF